jgi:phenylacetate-coenzyme A ligase PaaK-like adenylate-forming protein
MTAYEEFVTRQRSDVSDGLFGAVRRLRWSADRLAVERQRRLREQLAWSAERSPFWRDRLAEVDVATFTEAELPSLPILTKADLMDNFDQALTDPALDLAQVNHYVDHLDVDAYLDDRYRVIATAGSTGARGLIVYDWDDWVTFVLIATRWRVRSAGDPNASIGTLFASNTRHVSGAIHAFFSGEPGASVTHLPANLPLPQIVAGLNIARPTVLQGYPTAMHLLAVEAAAGRLSISPLQVMTCGEQCTAEVKANIPRKRSMSQLAHLVRLLVPERADSSKLRHESKQKSRACRKSVSQRTSSESRNRAVDRHRLVLRAAG